MLQPLRTTGPALPVAPPTGVGPIAAPQGAQALADRGDPRQAAQRLMALRATVVKALEAGDGAAMAQALAEGRALAARAEAGTSDPQLKAAFGEARQAFELITRQAVQAAPAPAEPPAPAEKRNQGMFGFVGSLLDQGGALVEKGARLVCHPLTLLGKGVDFVKEPLGKALGSLKTAIGTSAFGQLPVLGTAVRFTTGLTASVVGMVDGLVTAVTNPVDTVKGLGGMLWTASGMIPGLKMAYDVSVHGMTPLESLKGSTDGTIAIGKAMFGGAIEDFKAGNYAGAVGRLTGDVGSLFLGGAGAARAAVWAGKYGKVGTIGAKAITTLGRVVTVDAKLMELGAAGAGKLAGRLAKLPVADQLAAKLSRVEQAIAADAQVLKGGAHADELISPASRPRYASPKYLEGAVGRTFDKLSLPKGDGSYVTLHDVTIEKAAKGGVVLSTPTGRFTVPETRVDRLLYYPANAALMDALRVPTPKQLLAVSGETFKSLEIPRGDGSFTRIEDAKIAFANDTHSFVFDGQGQRWNVPHDRLARMLEHPGNAAVVNALEAKKAWKRAPIEMPDKVLDGLAVRVRRAEWPGTVLGGEARIPTSAAGAGGAVDGRIAGVSADGRLVVEGLTPEGLKLAKEMDAALAFKHNPQLLSGYPWGTSGTGVVHVLGDFDAATRSFKTLARGADGAWGVTAKTVPLDDVMRNARPFTDLPVVKITPDVRVIPYDEIGISIGEGAGFKIKSRADLRNVQRWFEGNLAANAKLFETLKGNARFVDAVKNWHGLDETAKVEVLKSAVAEFAKQNGFPAPDFKVVDAFADGRNGQFTPARRGVGKLDQAPGAIVVRRDLLNGNPEKILNTAIHEATHGRQWHAIERYRLGVLDATSVEHFFASQFSDSWSRISSAGADHYHGYRNNLIEQDAWAAGAEFSRRVAADPAFKPVPAPRPSPAKPKPAPTPAKPAPTTPKPAPTAPKPLGASKPVTAPKPKPTAGDATIVDGAATTKVEAVTTKVEAVKPTVDAGATTQVEALKPPAVAPVRVVKVKPVLDWRKLKDDVAIPGTRAPGRIEAMVDGRLRLVDGKGARTLHQVEHVVGNNPTLFNQMEFGTLPDGSAVMLGHYDPRAGQFATWTFDRTAGQFVASSLQIPLADVLRDARVFERLTTR